MSEKDRYHFAILDSKHTRAEFDCGVNALNSYLQKFATQNQRSGVSTTYVALSPAKNSKVVGYYTIGYAQIDFEFLPESMRRGLPKYPLSAVRIGRLAVDRAFHGTGLGKELLMSALYLAWSLMEKITLFAVVVDLTDESAKNFYLKYGFIPCGNSSSSLFLPMKDIRSIFERK